MLKFNILLVDDELNIREGISESLKNEGYTVSQAANGREAISVINSKEIDLVISDLKMPLVGGEDLLKKITSSYPTIPVIIITGHGTVENAVNAMRNGAFDFVTKPLNLDRLSLLIKRALSRRKLVLEHNKLLADFNRLTEKSHYSNLIGKSNIMLQVTDLVEQVAESKTSVLITGESGVGKELIADAIHKLSPRRDKPFIKVHCAALVEGLLESELFGHEKGAFTGALARKKGRFELADGGTIFLDEIGEIPLSTQVKILRVLQEKCFERVGGEESIEVDIRIVSATNRDLQKEVAESRFREDLYYRLNVVNINVPPLRDRKEDIPLMVSNFIRDFAADNDRKIVGIDKKASKALYNYEWPGNVRELRNCIESSVVLCRGDMISLDDLPPMLRNDNLGEDIVIPVGMPLEQAEMIIIQRTLQAQNNNKLRTAETLGISRKTLHRKLDNSNS